MRLSIGLAGLLALAACGPAAKVCAPGATQSCLCVGGGAGVQVCDAAGAAWGACDCGGADATGEDAKADHASAWDFFGGRDDAPSPDEAAPPDGPPADPAGTDAPPPDDVVGPDGTDPGPCVPACEGKACGGDGCGGSCGTCGDGTSCLGGQCSAACKAPCAGKACGPDACGGTCGECPGTQVCTSAGQCVATCTGKCDNKKCGDDGCGHACGACPAGQSCAAGACVAGCTPQCGGKVCGDDGCGGACGQCKAGITCTVGGVCGNACMLCPASPDCLSLGFEDGNLIGWALEGTVQVVTHLGATTAPEGTHMLLVSNAGRDGIARFPVCLPAGTGTLKFRWRLFSAEFEEWCGSEFQDTFRMSATDASGKESTLFLRTINDLCRNGAGEPSPCATCGAQFVGLEKADVVFDKDDVWRTPWQEASVPVGSLAAAAQPVTLQVFVGSKGDSIFDTVVLLDDVRFLAGCTADCAGKTCGDDGCGGSCGSCGDGKTCVAGTCTGADCGTCPAGTPICAVPPGGAPACVQCLADADCKAYAGCTCVSNTCIDGAGAACKMAQAVCTATCQKDADCPKTAGGAAQACHASGRCYDPAGTCDGSTSCCAKGFSCYDLGASLFGGGVPGASPATWPYCSCNGQADCLSSQPCTDTATMCSLPLIGQMVCPSGTVPQGVPAKMCVDLATLLGGVFP